MSPCTTRPLILALLPVAVISMLIGTGMAAASPSSTPEPTAKVDCVAYDSTGTKCEIAGVVYAITQIDARTHIGGAFASLGGTPRANVAAIRTDGTLDPTWNPSTLRNRLRVGRVVRRQQGLPRWQMDDEVYIGGHFNTLPEAKLSRVALASFLPENGTATAWNPGANGSFGVWAFGLTRTSLSPNEPAGLSIGGDFTRVSGLARRGYARFLF